MCSPGLNTAFLAQPLTRRQNGPGSSRKKGCSRRILSRPSTSAISLPPVVGTDRCRFFGDVDADRAPRDAPPTADTAGDPELIDPVRELVGHPLAITRADLPAHATAVNVGMAECEAGIPTLNALRNPAGKVGDIVNDEAEAGGADERAVAAGEAAFGHLSPPRMLHVALQQLLEPFGLQLTTHAPGRTGDDLLGLPPVALVRGPKRQRAGHLDARLTSRLDKKRVPLAIEKLREG